MSPTEHRSTAAMEIRNDLRRMRTSRVVAVSTYIALIGILLGALYLAPPKSVSLEHDGAWMAALFLLFAGSGLGAAIAVGFPLVPRSSFYILGAIAAAALLSGLVLTLDPSLAFAETNIASGTRCFVFGSAISSVAMVALGVLSGRLWRRFPDPGLFLALGVTGVGLAALHLRCPATDPVHLFGFHLTPLLLIFFVTRLAVRTREHLLRQT